MRYVDWVESVLRCVIEHHDPRFMFGMENIGKHLGLDVGGWGDAEHRPMQDAIAAACSDLAQFDLVDVKNQYIVLPTLKARKYERASLREMWPELRAGDLQPEDEQFLRGVAALSHHEQDRWAEVRYTTTMEVFNFLNWPWDRDRSRTLLHITDSYVFTESVVPLGDEHTVRLRWPGAVRVDDSVGDVLQEPRDHLAVGRYRAAGCIAGVVLEGVLKDLCRENDAVVPTALPTLSHYNDALSKKQVYPKTTWRKIQHLTDLRNLCAHVLDREPSYDNAQELIEGVDDVLRDLYPQTN